MTVPRKYRKLFQDSIVVEIPLSEPTADMGVILKRARAKRIKQLYEHFPSLAPKKDTVAQSSPADNTMEAQDDEDSNKEQEEPLRKKAKILDETLPQRQQYGSIVDYLEAKYVRGVMLGDKIDESEASEKESVYSEDSWLDDSLLKRDVAEQVLSHSTQTKVGVDDADDFFVNVGNLEVEDNDLMDYDPVEDEKAAEKAKKRKRSSSTASAKSGKSGKATPKKSGGPKSVASRKKDTPTSSDGAKKEKSEDIGLLKQKAAVLEAAVKHIYDRLVSDIKAMSKDDLPQKIKNVQVTLTVMEGKAPGDTITFANPHVPNQRLKVQIPEGKGPGSLFKVNIPAPEVDEETQKDTNSFTREFKDLVADYATTYDLWCRAEADYHEADPNFKGKYPYRVNKIAKFDELVKVFPKNLLTPIDAAYMKIIVRRARQNKSKRKEATDDTVATAIVAATKPAAKAKAKPSPKAKAKTKPAMKVDVKSMPKAPKHRLMKTIKPVKQPKPEVATTIEIILPSKGRVFPQQELRHDEFEGMTN